MLEQEFPVLLDNAMTRMAIAMILLGGVVVRLVGWQVAGWVAVGIGMVSLWLAHQFAIAPHCDE